MPLPKHIKEYLDKSLDDVIKLARSTGKTAGYCVGTTMNEGNDEYFISAIRESEYQVCGNVMISHTRDLDEIVQLLDGKMDDILIDVERKRDTCDNMDDIVRVNACESKIGYFRGNEIAAFSFEHILVSICRMKNRTPCSLKACIVGAGHLGAKIANILVEYGAIVDLLDLDIGRAQDVVSAVHVLTARYCHGNICAISRNDITKNKYSVIIGATNGVPVIDGEIIASVEDDGFVIDAGLRTLTNEAIDSAGRRGLLVSCLMVMAGFSGMMTARYYAGESVKRMARRDISDGFSMVSGGVIGRYGDVIVDDVVNPRKVIGLAKGDGLVLSGTEKNALNDRVERVMQIINEKM